MRRLTFLLLILVSFACSASGSGTDRHSVFSEDQRLRKPFMGRTHRGHMTDEDTIFYDDGYGFWYCVAGYEWAVRFSAEVPCTLHAVLTMSFGFGDSCSLFVRDDSAGLPGQVVTDAAYQGGGYPAWDRVDLPTPYYDMNSFWITGRYPKPPYIIADSANDWNRSYYSFDAETWLGYTAGDLIIRAIVSYGDTLAHDVSVTAIANLPTGVRVDTQYVLGASYVNLGRSAENFVVEVLVQDSLGFAELDTLSDSIFVPRGGAGEYSVTWAPRSYGETYSLAAISLMQGDMNPANDTVTAATWSYMEGEISYDDFSCEVWLNVDRDDDDKFGVKFSVPYAPCHVTGARIFVDDTLSFEHLALCPNSQGLPDTVNPYVTASGIAAARAPSWIWVDFDTSLARVDEDTVWLVLKWPDSRNGPYVGSDRHYPVDGNSWAYSDSTGWSRWTSSDFMMRIVCTPPTGTDEREHVRPPSTGTVTLSPNPFCSQTRLTFIEPPGPAEHESEGNSAVVYDLAGRSVRVFSDADVEELLSAKGLIWNGGDDRGRPLPSGVYFLVLRAAGHSCESKVVLLR